MRKTYYIVMIGTVLLLSMGSSAGASARSLSVDSMMDVAVMEYERGALYAAALGFNKVLMIDPENLEAQIWLSRCGFPQGMEGTESPRLQKADHSPHHACSVNKKGHEEGARLAHFSDRSEEDIHRLSQDVSQLKRDAQCGFIRSTRAFLIPENQRTGSSLQDEYAQAIETAFGYEKELQNLDAKYAHLRTRSQYLYVHQDKLIKVLEDYLFEREDELNGNKDELIFKEISMAKTIQRLLAKLDEIIEKQDSINHYLSRMDDQGIFAQRSEEVEDIRTKLHRASTELTVHDAKEFNRKIRLSRIEKALEEAQERVSLLMN